MKPIFRIFRYLKHFPVQIVLNVLCNILHIIFNLGSYILIVPFVQLMFGIGDVPDAEPAFALNQHQLSEWAFWHLEQFHQTYGLWRCLLVIAGAYLTCSLLSNLFRFLGMVFLGVLRNGLVEVLRNNIYHKITILPISFFNSSRRGDMISRMANDLFDIDWSIFNTMQSFIKDPINIIVFSATLIFISPTLFLLFVVVLPAGVWLIAHIAKSLKHNSQQGQEQLGGLFAMLDEALLNIRVVKAFGHEADIAKRFATANDDYASTMLRVARRRELSGPLSEVLGTLALVFILIVGGWQVIDGNILPSVFILFVIIFARLVPPIQATVRAYNSMLKGSASAARFLEILDADEVVLEKADAEPLETFAHSIEFRNVSFAYADGKHVLHNINLTIPHGSTVAIVGPSGAGKSTLVDLMPRFYDCTDGSILIDGHDLRDLNINSLRSKFGIVSQDCILFNDTVANNISFGSTDYTIEQIQAAAEAANAHSFISQLPQGYDTHVGDRGTTLSGGQRQRISIARALLRNSPCLILDEATSALDTEAELAVRQGLETLMQGRTTIIIAHRLATIQHADTIVVLDEGRIVEQGTHDSLLALNGLYKKMVDMQTFNT